jgi:hypothetical protein
MMSSSAWRSVSMTANTIPAGTRVTVRTIEAIDPETPDGYPLKGVVTRNVFGSMGNVLIDKGTKVELIARRVSDNQVDLDLNCIAINGQPFAAKTPGFGEHSVPVAAADVPSGTLLRFRLAVPFVVQ